MVSYSWAENLEGFSHCTSKGILQVPNSQMSSPNPKTGIHWRYRWWNYFEGQIFFFFKQWLKKAKAWITDIISNSKGIHLASLPLPILELKFFFFYFPGKLPPPVFIFKSYFWRVSPHPVTPRNYPIWSSPPLTWVSLKIKTNYRIWDIIISEFTLLKNVQGYFSFNTTEKDTDCHNLMVLVMQLLGFPYTSFVLKQPFSNTALSPICKGKEIRRKRNCTCVSFPSQETKIKLLVAAAKFLGIFFWVCKSVSSL